MKKLALLLCGLGSLAVLSVSAANYTSPQPEPQYQEQCVAEPCYPDTTCYQLPCNAPVAQEPSTPAPCDPAPCYPAPCAPDTVCNPAPCAPAPCAPGC